MAERTRAEDLHDAPRPRREVRRARGEGSVWTHEHSLTARAQGQVRKRDLGQASNRSSQESAAGRIRG
jgi:hypothetical protein